MKILAVDGVPVKGAEAEIICGRCGKDISIEFYNMGGNCTYCGDNLCAACAGEWNEYGECRKCADEGD